MTCEVRSVEVKIHLPLRSPHLHWKMVLDKWLHAAVGMYLPQIVVTAVWKSPSYPSDGSDVFLLCAFCQGSDIGVVVLFGAISGVSTNVVVGSNVVGAMLAVSATLGIGALFWVSAMIVVSAKVCLISAIVEEVIFIFDLDSA